VGYRAVEEKTQRDLESKASSQHTPLILVADDNRINRAVVTATFKDSDYRIVEATNGREAIELAFSEPPDLVLMDLMMPEMDGLEATRILKDDDRTNRIPILMLTALSETDDRISAFDSGVTGFLTKPFDRLELMAHVRSYLNLSLVNRKYILSTANRNTGFPNRAAFREEAGEYEAPILYLIKIDNLETIARFYGESKAVELQRRFADTLMEIPVLRRLQRSRIYHFSSGYFGVLADWSMPREAALDVAEEMYRDFQRKQDAWEELQYESDFTIGVSVDAEDLLGQAELAVNEAVKSRVNIVYAPDIAEAAYELIETNMVWLRKIRNALARDAFIPLFQPIVNTTTGEVYKYEALVRMIDEDGSYASPGDFLVVAKNSKYYAKITQLVIQKAIDAFQNRREGVAINLSVLDIDNDETREFIFAALEENPDVARRLTIEIVEEEGLVHYDRVKGFIKKAKQFGATIAIDDFGSGYSNFVRIVDLDIDFIKIDGSLIRNVDTDPVIRNLVQGIKSFAAFSGIAVVAEFVENAGIMECMRSAGIEYSQGYYIGRPVTPDRMEDRCVSTGNSSSTR
jgi:EAL domain-containing protein (putative c-di-GMP-specific phosphodiesterase class I)/CheY-like chemotaxis protein